MHSVKQGALLELDLSTPILKTLEVGYKQIDGGTSI